MRVAVALDPPGETKRQARTFLIWILFLLTAVIIAAQVGTRTPDWLDPTALDPRASEVRQELERSRSARMRVALVLGLLSPMVCTFALSRSHRRNGWYPRGITVEVTDEELRIWGRGYGSRVALSEAAVEERLVDVYAGRLGAWRQVRLRVRGKHQTLELAAPAKPGDERNLRLEGGEGDCVELNRDDYEALRRELFARVSRPA
jgi:hypothetical protein